MSPEPPLSDDFVAAARAEREKLAEKVAEYEVRATRLEASALEARTEAESVERRIRALDEILGIAPQIALCEMSEELRGERLREVALDVLREAAADGRPIHYRAWFEAILGAGYRVAGQNPLATFLTHASRIERVERVGRRSGLYRLRLAA
jgi:hypothetical protein